MGRFFVTISAGCAGNLFVVNTDGHLGLIERLYQNACPRIAACRGNRMARRRSWSPKNRKESRETIARRVARFDATVVDAIRRMRAEGATFREIAAALPATGHPPPGGRACWQPGGWSHVAVMRIAKRNGIA